MEQTANIELTREEAEQLSALIEECLAAMRKAHEEMAKDQAEIEQLQAETRAIIARMRERQHVETTL